MRWLNNIISHISLLGHGTNFSKKYLFAIWLADKIYSKTEDPFVGFEENKTLTKEQVNYFYNMDLRIFIYNILYVLEKITYAIILIIIGYAIKSFR